MAGPSQPVKLCPSCGASLPGDANICSTCGHNFNTGPYAQPPGPQMGSFTPPPGTFNPPGYANPHLQANYPRSGYDPPATGAADGFAIASLVLGILSIPLLCLCYTGVPFALLALIFGGLGLKGGNRGMAIAGVICAGICLLLLVCVLIFIGTGGFGMMLGGQQGFR